MLNFLRSISLAIVAMVVTEAHAGTVTFVERPEPMTWAETQECTFWVNGAQRYIRCLPEQAPSRYSAVLMDDSGRVFVEQRSTTVAVTCLNGVCQGGATNEFYGRIPEQLDNILFSMPYGYYLSYDAAIDAVNAHQRGTGPEAHRFPAYIILDEQGPPTADNKAVTYRLYCSPQDDLCDYTEGNQEYRLTRDELPKYIPMVSAPHTAAYCYFEACYNANDEVIGLNPDFLWE